MVTLPSLAHCSTSAVMVFCMKTLSEVAAFTASDAILSDNRLVISVLIALTDCSANNFNSDLVFLSSSEAFFAASALIFSASACALAMMALASCSASAISCAASTFPFSTPSR